MVVVFSGGRGREDYGKDRAHLRPASLDKLYLSGVWNSPVLFQSITSLSVLAFQSSPTELATLWERIPSPILTDGASGIVEIL